MKAEKFKESLTILGIAFTETVISESKNKKRKQIVIRFKNLLNRNTSRTFHVIKF